MKLKTYLSLTLGAVLVLSLGVLAFRTEPVPVDLGIVSRGPMAVTVDVDGKTRVADVFEVAAPIRGTARRSPVQVGDLVRRGETVVALIEPAASDPLDYRSRVQAEAAIREAEAGLYAARSSLRQAEEELELAGRESERAKELVRKGVASITRAETAEVQLAIRTAAVQAAVSNLERAKGALDRTRAQLIEPEAGIPSNGGCCLEIRSPADGHVLEVEMISERPVIAGSRLLSIGATDQLEIVADVLSSDAVRLRPGNRAEVLRWGGQVALEARVARIEPAAFTKVSALGIEEQRVNVVLELLTPVEDRPALRHGFSVFLRIVEWEAEELLQVPLAALFRHGTDWAVFVEEEGVARLQVVEIGRFGRDRAELRGPLDVDTPLLLHPGTRITDGTRVVPRVAE